MHLPRLLPLLAFVLATTLVACTPGTPDGDGNDAPDAAAVNAAMRHVADSRAEVEAAVVEVMRSVGRLPAVAEGLRSPAVVDEMLDEVPALAASVAARGPADLRGSVDGLDQAIVDAVVAIDTTAAGLDASTWEARYLDAQREVLAALGAWAGASRSLVDALDEGWSTYERFAAKMAELDENRWRYRSREEAAGTWEVEMGADVPALSAATATLDSFVVARDAAAADVATADAQAAAVFEDRPASP